MAILINVSEDGGNILALWSLTEVEGGVGLGHAANHFDNCDGGVGWMLVWIIQDARLAVWVERMEWVEWERMEWVVWMEPHPC